MRTATVLVVPGDEFFRFAVGEVDVGCLSASATTVIPIVDDGHAVKDETESVVGGGAEVVGVVFGWQQPTRPTHYHVLGEVGAEYRTAAPSVGDVR